MMIFCLLLMAFITLGLLAIKLKNRYALVFVFGFFSVSLLIFSNMLYIVKMSNYIYLFQFEFYLYNLIAKVRINYYDIKLVVLLSVALYLFSMNLLIYNSGHSLSSLSDKLKAHVGFMCVSLLLIILNSSDCSEFLYLLKNDEFFNINTNLVVAAEYIVIIFNYAAVAFYTFVPYYCLKREYSSDMLFKKRHIKIMAVSLLLLQSTFFTILFLGPLKFYLNLFFFEQNGESYAYNSRFYIFLPMLLVLISGVIMGILIKFRALDEVSFFKKRAVVRKKHILYSDVRHIFHSYKNSMLVIMSLVEKARKSPSHEECCTVLDDINRQAQRLSVQANKFLDVYNKPDLTLQEVNVTDCIDAAVEKYYCLYSIAVNKNYAENTTIFADTEHISEMYYNVIANAAESIARNGGKDGRIDIRVWTEQEWVCSSIRDNGCGMDKSTVKNMFKPFFSSKRTFENWGIGLSSVKNTVEAHLGFIDVRSEVGKYTEIQIIFPMDNCGV